MIEYLPTGSIPCPISLEPQIFPNLQAEAIEDTKLMLEEMVHLVEKQFPQVNTALVYRRLSYTRAAHNAYAHVNLQAESRE